ncbi:ribose-phosphate pyrophosphokinase-like domain-containing protein, partial [Lysinibacillus capsici]
MQYHYANSQLKIFSLNSNNPLAQEIAQEMGVELGKSSVKHFSDG